MNKVRARLSILNELLRNPAVRGEDWEHDIFGEQVQVGDLISLSFAPINKWYVSWIKDIKKESDGTYLLESIEDQELRWWSNVSISVFNREIVKERSSWRWDDKQFEFYDRWLKVGKRNGAYMLRPGLPIFTGKDVILNVRVAFSLTAFSNPKTFSNWKKLPMKEMDEYYKECDLKWKNGEVKKKCNSKVS